MTAELKSMLRKKNRLMRRGKIEEADAVACKIRNLVAKDNASRLKSLETNDNKELWKEVNRIIMAELHHDPVKFKSFETIVFLKLEPEPKVL